MKQFFRRGATLCLALALALIGTTSVHANTLQDHIKADYQGRSNLARASTMPRRLGAGVYQSPNGTAITEIVIIAKPAAHVSDGITRTGYYSSSENKYWVHVTGGIAGFNYWEGPVELGPKTNGQGLKFTIYSTGQNSGGSKPGTLVIRETPAWVSAGNEHNILNTVPEPDFGDDTALAIFAGQKNTGGHSIKVDRIYRDRLGTIVVEYSEKAPAAGSMVTMAITSPYVIVTIPRTLLPIKFAKAKVPAPVAPLAFKSLASGIMTGISSKQAQNIVLSSQKDFDTFWSQHQQGIKPTVDFTKETIVALLMGTRNSSGFSVKVTGAKRTAAKVIEVSADYIMPNPRAVRSAALTHPFEIISLNSVGDKISFNIAGANTANYTFSDIVFQRSRPKDLELDQLSVDSQGHIGLRVINANGTEIRKLDSKISSAKVVAISDAIDDCDFYNYANPSRVRGFRPDPKLRSFRNNVVDVNKGLNYTIAYNTATKHGPDYQSFHNQMISLIDSFQKPVVVLADFDEITLIDRTVENGGFRIAKTVLKKDGSIERTLSAPTIKTQPQIGKISSAEMKKIQTLYTATDFMNLNFPLIKVQQGTPLTMLSAVSGKAMNNTLHPSSSPVGPKVAEIEALEKAIRALNVTSPTKGFDSLVYSQTVNGFIGETKSVTIQNNGNVVWTVLKNGQASASKKGSITSAELADLNKAFADTDFMNQSFPKYLARPGSRDSNIQASANGQMKEFPHAQGMVSGPKAFELMIFESKLEAILKRHKPTPARFDELSFKLEDVVSGEVKQIQLKGTEVNWTVSSPNTQAATGNFSVTAAEVDSLQNLYNKAGFKSLPSTMPMTTKPAVKKNYELSAQEKGVDKVVSGTDFSNEPQEFTSFRVEVEKLLQQIVITKSDIILASINRITANGSSNWVVTTKTASMVVTGPKQNLLEGLSGRWGKLEGVIKGKEFELTKVITPEKVVVVGQTNAAQDQFVTANQSYELYGRMNSVLKHFQGQDTSVKAWLYNKKQLEVISVFATSKTNSWGVPFAFIAKGETIEITQDYGKYVSVNVDDGSNGVVNAGTKLKNLAPRVVTNASTSGVTRRIGGLIK